eukprot:GHVS01062766.1.p1 GENE.GHVS01062766.1~~GHVS01062766.1.p1  ORF type:complete len:161 (+),score=25.32 GHVS01062766.1:755-1237(+)
MTHQPRLCMFCVLMHSKQTQSRLMVRGRTRMTREEQQMMGLLTVATVVLAFFYSTDDDAVTCGSTNTTKTAFSQSSAAAPAASDSDVSVRYNYTFTKIDVTPSPNDTTAVHNLCWAGADDGSYNTLVTLSEAVTVYGPHPDNYVATCSADGTECMGHWEF